MRKNTTRKHFESDLSSNCSILTRLQHLSVFVLKSQTHEISTQYMNIDSNTNTDIHY